MTFLYDYVCDNRMVHGAREVKELTIRHTKGAPERFARQARPLLRAYAEASVSEVEAGLARATRTMVGKSDEEILEWPAGETSPGRRARGSSSSPRWRRETPGRSGNS
jgi:hypothetical protein